MNLTRSNFGSAPEAEQFDEYGDAGELAAEMIHEIAACLHGAAGGEDIVDDEHALAADDGVGVHFESVLAVL